MSKTKKNQKLNQKLKKNNSIWEYTQAILMAVILALFVRAFVVQAFKIPSGSMLETLQIGDFILVNKFLYGIKEPFADTVIIPIRSPRRGDVVVFEFPEDPDKDYIKKVIGVGGDKVEIKNKKVFINGKPIEEPYTRFSDTTILSSFESNRDNFGPVIVPQGMLFVMGDNRDESYDSRLWRKTKFVEVEKVRGKAFIIYWSWMAERFDIRWSRLGQLVH